MSKTSLFLTRMVVVALAYCWGSDLRAEGSPWRFALIVYAEANDNRATTSAEKVNTLKYGIGPRVSYRNQLDTYYLDFFYAPMYTRFTKPQKNQTGKGYSQVQWELSHTAGILLWSDVTQRLRLKVGDYFYYVSDPLVYNGEETYGGVDNYWWKVDQSRYDNRLFGSALYQLTPQLSISADAYHRMLRYNQRKVAVNANQDDMGLYLALSKQQTAAWAYGIYANYIYATRKEYDDPGSHPKYGIQTLVLGLNTRYELTGTSQARAQWGYLFARYEDSRIENQQYPMTLDLSVKSSLTPRMDTVFGYNQVVGAANMGNYVGATDYKGYAVLSWRHSERWISTYRAEYVWTDYNHKHANADLESAKIKSFFLRLGLNYQATDALLLSAYYYYVDVSATIPAAHRYLASTYYQNVVGVRAAYTF